MCILCLGDSMDVKLEIRIREQRKQLGVSIRQLEAMSGVSRNYISEIETGRSIPSIIILCKIAKALKVPVNSLFDYS